MDYKQKYLKYKNKYLKLKQIAGSKIPSEQVTHKVLKGHTDRVNSVAFNNGKDDPNPGTMIVSGSDDKTIRVWNVDTGECILTLKGHTGTVESVGFNHDGTKIVSGSKKRDPTIRVWNVDAKSDNYKYGECILTLKGHTYDVWSVGFNHDGTKIVSGSSDNTIRIWNVDTGKLEKVMFGRIPIRNKYDKKTYPSHEDIVWSVAFNNGKDDPNPGTKIVSGSADKTAVIWNVNAEDKMNDIIYNLSRPQFFNDHRGDVASVSFNHDGTMIVSGSQDKTVQVWPLSVLPSGKIWSYDKTILKGHTNIVQSVTFNHDGTQIASGSQDNTIRVWNVDRKRKMQDKILNGHIGSVWSVGFNHDGTKIVSGSSDKTIRIWDVLSADPDTDVSMDQCKNKSDGLLNEPWKNEDYRNTVFLKFTMQNGSKETWCLTEKFYPADPNVLGDTDETVSRDNYVYNMLYANWVEKSDGSPYTIDKRMGRDGEPGSDRYVRITSIFDGYARYVLFDDVLKRVITIKQGDGRTRDNSEIGFNNDVQYPLILHLEYAKHVAIGNIRGTLGISESHGNVSDDVYRVTRIEEKTIHK